MKSYDEITNNLLERRDTYISDQNIKRNRTIKIGTSLCSFCLAVLLGFGVWQSGILNTASPDDTVKDTLYPGIKDTFDDKRGDSPTNPIIYNQEYIVCNEIVLDNIDEALLAKMNIALMIDDYVTMTWEELIEYYGMDYTPEVPEDLISLKGCPGGIYRRNGGTGEIYWDANNLEYRSEDSTRTLTLTVDKASYVFVDYFCFKGTEKKSVINNTDVLLGKSESGVFYAEFMYKNVGFLICSEGLTEEEIVSVIASVIK